MSAAAELREWAKLALNRHRTMGTLPTSLRHLFYEAVMEGVITKVSNTGAGRRADQNLTEAVTQLRESGEIPWSWLEDRTRRMVNHGADGVTIRSGLEHLIDRLTIDPYPGVMPVLVVESESVAGVLDYLAQTYRTVIVPTRGQANGWIRTRVASAFHPDLPLAVGYVGDFDFSGEHIERNTERVMREVLNVDSWARVALTEDQVNRFGLPVIDRFDKRTQSFHSAVEVEALPIGDLLNDVQRFLDGYLSESLDDVEERESRQRAEIRQLLGMR